MEKAICGLFLFSPEQHEDYLSPGEREIWHYRHAIKAFIRQGKCSPDEKKPKVIEELRNYCRKYDEFRKDYLDLRANFVRMP